MHSQVVILLQLYVKESSVHLELTALPGSAYVPPTALELPGNQSAAALCKHTQTSANYKKPHVNSRHLPLYMSFSMETARTGSLSYLRSLWVSFVLIYFHDNILLWCSLVILTTVILKSLKYQLNSRKTCGWAQSQYLPSDRHQPSC